MTLFTITRGKTKMILSPLAFSLSPSVFHRAAMLLLFVTAACFADDAAKNFSTSAPITVKNYCDFLNANATSDPFHLYDEKMSVDLEGACVQRSGMPEHYFYAPLPGKENAAVGFLNENDVVQYCAWKNKNSAQSFSPQPLFQPAACSLPIDPLLETRDSPQLTGVESSCQGASGVKSALDANTNVIAEVGGFFAVAAAFSFCPALGVRGVENESLAATTRRPESEGISTTTELENRTAPTNENRPAIEKNYVTLPRPNESGMKKIFARDLVSFNEPDMPSKIEATHQGHTETQGTFRKALQSFSKKNPSLPKITTKKFLRSRGASNEALLKSIADLYTTDPETKKTLEQEVNSLTNHALVCNVLFAKKAAQEKSKPLFIELRKKIAAVYQENIASDGKNFNKPKTDFGLTLQRYQKIAEKLAEYADKYEQALCSIGILSSDTNLPPEGRLTAEQGSFWFCAMKHLVAENKEETRSAIQEAKKFDRLILYKHGIAQSMLKAKHRPEELTYMEWFHIKTAWEAAATAYGWASVQEIFTNNANAAQAYYKGACAHDQNAEALTQQITALKQGAQSTATLWKSIADAHHLIAESYKYAAFEEMKNHTNAAQAYYKSAHAHEQNVQALTQQMIALKQGDQSDVTFWKYIARAHELAAHCYKSAAAGELSNNNEVPLASLYATAQVCEECVNLLMSMKASPPPPEILEPLMMKLSWLRDDTTHGTGS